MKKIFKVLIAFVLIAAIAVGVYFIFFHKSTDNGQIYVKTITLNESQNYAKVNSTVKEMILDISINEYDDISDIQYDFLMYMQIVECYELVYNEILENGLFVNNVDTSKNYSEMNKSYNALVDIYQNATNYLETTYWKNPSKTYIVNFNNIFKDALKYLNGFYFNAGMSYLTATDNTIKTNNLYKAELEYYLFLTNRQVELYIESEGSASLSILTLIKAQANDVTSDCFDKYIKLKEHVDEFYVPSIDRKLFVEKYLAGKKDEYLQEIKDTEKHSKLTYYSAIIIGA